VNLSILKIYLNMFHQVPSPKSLSLIFNQFNQGSIFKNGGSLGNVPLISDC
jgi:hypothetical protein